MSSPARRGRPRSEAAGAAIYRAAIAEVRRVGYDAVTMDAIARRAGVGKATLYRRWKSKELLVVTALARLMRNIPIPRRRTTRAELYAVMDDQVALYADPATGELLSGLVAAMARNKRLARAVREALHETRRQALVAVLERGIARGTFPPTLDRELAVEVLNGPLFLRFLFTGRDVDRAAGRAMADVLLRAFAISGRGRARSLR